MCGERAPLLALRLKDGRRATLSLGPVSTVLGVDEVRAFSYDVCGRPFAIAEADRTWRRALSGRLLEKGIDTEGRRVRRLVSADEGAPVVEAARGEVEAALAAVAADPGLAHARGEALRRLGRIASMDAHALCRDAERFAALYGAVGILPPDQYLALVVQATRGCSWNACTFCSFYREVPFHVRSREELDAHVEAVRDYFGESLALRRSIFLGDANALCVAQERLRPLLEVVARAFPPSTSPGPRGLYAFVDAWTGARKTVAEWRACAGLGLQRVYVGLETGDPELLAWLEKAGSPGDAVELVRALHEAGIAAGVIVLVGAGGERFFNSHVRRTAEVLTQMELGPGDIIYLSELVEPPGLEYARRASGEEPLTPPRLAQQREAIRSAYRPAEAGRPPRLATYDIREFVY